MLTKWSCLTQDFHRNSGGHLIHVPALGQDLIIFLYNRHHGLSEPCRLSHTISLPMLICPHWKGNWKKEPQIFFTGKNQLFLSSSTKMDYSSSLWLFQVNGKELHLAFFFPIFHRFHSRVVKWFLPLCNTILDSYPVVPQASWPWFWAQARAPCCLYWSFLCSWETWGPACFMLS